MLIKIIRNNMQHLSDQLYNNTRYFYDLNPTKIDIVGRQEEG